ncbi:putative nuclease HARBI1 [Camellia sinensis]|uniref:putative nuclease HARBI1 n=1 Tax=Camellia sinensis TaxID=4442 RepID=UPI001036B027|nr:putative nuclease HARBI1 [Camellia sinensis]
MNSIKDSLPGFFNQVFVLLFHFLLPSHQTQISIDFHRFFYLCSSCFTILLRSEIADLTLVGISDSQHHSENRSNRGSSSASIGDLQSLNSIDNSLPESFDQDCVGAIDGTHFRVRVPNKDAQRYRGRKCYPTQNALAACSFDLKFTYILPGWEGSASDSRILDNALTREMDKLIVPQGKYYLVDVGFQLKTRFLAPYRSTRYHLKEYSVHQPENSRELFNLRHASLRNAIERAFGVLKKRFPILGSGT